MTAPAATAVLLLNAGGLAVIQVPVPAIPGLAAYLQAVSIDASLNLESSNGLAIENNY